MTGAAFDPRREAIVIAPAGEVEALPGAASPAAPASGQSTNDAAAIVRAAGSEVRVQAACRARCLLVLTDLHYPGWRAYVDGQETRIHQTNGPFRGVTLDPGAHEVVYRYEPASVRIGLWMLLASLAIAAAVWHRGRRSR
jgi:uncharacterized membrane protein YfhO